MATITLDNKGRTKKLIELPNDSCRRLAVQAAAMGTSVKRLIENLVISSIEDADDEAIYAYLQQTRPEGNVMLTDSEQSSLLADLRKKASEE